MDSAIKVYWKVVIWVLFITIVSILPKSAFDPFTIPFWKKIYLDKGIHTFLYIMLGGFWIGSLRKQSRSMAVFITIVFGIFLGTITEFIQLLMSAGRSFDWGDMAANHIGTAVSVLFGFRASKKRFFVRIFG